MIFSNTRLWAEVTLALSVLLIVLGAATQITDSGMSCPDWPWCYGMLFPYPAPDGGYVVAGQVYQFYQVMLEYTHRLAASLVGFALLILLWFAVREKTTRAWSIIASTLLAMQIGLGALTVMKFNIPWSVMLHVGNAMLFLGALWVVRVRSIGAPALVFTPTTKYVLYAFTLSVFLTLLMGSYMSSSNAGGVCGGLFACMGEWLPEDKSQLIHMKHRYFALFTLLLAVVLVVRKRWEVSAPTRTRIITLKMILAFQLALGIATLYSFSHYADFYIPLSISHLLVATLLWLALVDTLARMVKR